MGALERLLRKKENARVIVLLGSTKSKQVKCNRTECNGKGCNPAAKPLERAPVELIYFCEGPLEVFPLVCSPYVLHKQKRHVLEANAFGSLLWKKRNIADICWDPNSSSQYERDASAVVCKPPKQYSVLGAGEGMCGPFTPLAVLTTPYSLRSWQIPGTKHCKEECLL